MASQFPLWLVTNLSSLLPVKHVSWTKSMNNKEKLLHVFERCVLPVVLALVIFVILLVPITLYITVEVPNRRNTSGSMIENNINVTRTNSSFNCSKDFYFNGYCRPRCSRWSHYRSRDAVLILTGVFSGFGLVICTLIFIIAGLRYKIILKFPTVFVLYATVMYCIRDAILYTSSIANNQLYCNSNDDLFESFDNPTIFCIIFGIVYQYTSVSVPFWWLAWASVTFLKLIFPLRSRAIQIQGKCCYIHAILTLIGIFVPTIGIIIASSIETEPYIFDDIPPTICIPRHYGIHFYSTIFPDIIMTSIYSVMVIVTIIIIHRHESHLFKVKAHFHFTLAEKKLIFILILNIFLECCLFITTAVWISLLDKVEETLNDYFICEGGGSGKDCKLVVDIGAFLGLKITNIITSGLLPLGPLFYVINWSATKRYICKCRSASEAAQNSTSSTTCS